MHNKKLYPNLNKDDMIYYEFSQIAEKIYKTLLNFDNSITKDECIKKLINWINSDDQIITIHDYLIFKVPKSVRQNPLLMEFSIIEKPKVELSHIYRMNKLTPRFNLKK